MRQGEGRDSQNHTFLRNGTAGSFILKSCEFDLRDLHNGPNDVFFILFFIFFQGPGEIPLNLRMSAKGVSCSITLLFLKK